MSNVPPSQGQSSHKRALSSQLNASDRSNRPRIEAEKPPVHQSGLASPDVPGPPVTDRNNEWKDYYNDIIMENYDGLKNSETKAPTSTTLDYSLLLNVIVRYAPSYELQTTSQFTKTVIDSLIATSPSARKTLDQAWANKKFNRVLPELLKEISKPTENLARTKQAAIQSQAAVTAWNNPYRTEHHQLLYDNINNMARVELYSNTASIIQSSGSGKSRMVDELAKTLFTIPFNLRAEDPKNTQGSWPPPDADVRELLRRHVTSEEKCKIFYYEFLGCVFRSVKEILQNSTGAPLHIHEHAANSWRSHLALAQNRVDLYQKICSETGMIEPSSAVSEPRPEARDKALAELQSLLQLIPQPLSTVNQPVKLMLYFDEADALDTVIADSEDKKTLYDVLLWCLNHFVPEPLFVLFLSTKSDGAYFAPASEMARSSRVRDGFGSLQAPITETPFDCHPKLPVDPATLNLDSIRSIEFLSMFGRPLWWSMRGALVQRNDVPPAVADSTIAAKDKDVALAVLDVRLMLSFEPNREINDMSTRLVSSHMRTAYSIPAHRRYIRSGYPSEPVLAEAAAQQMRTYRTILQTESGNSAAASEQYVSPTITALGKTMENALLDFDERGEVIARVILTEAYDRAVESDYFAERSSTPGFKEPLWYSRGCKLTTFAREVFTNPDGILHSFPDNVPSKTSFQDAFKDSIIRFTHFAKMRDNSVLSPNVLLSGFIRCVAFVGHATQEGADIFVPVLIDSKLPISISNITGLLIQLKKRKTAGTIAAYAIDAEKLNLFRDKGDETVGNVLNPYLTWIMELGVERAPSRDTQILTKAFERPLPTESQPDKRPSQLPKGPTSSTPRASATVPFTPSKMHIPTHGQKKNGRHAKKLHPRYALKVHGCSNTVYKGITAAEKKLYSVLLASGGLLEEHARKDMKSLNAVRALKPFWARGPASFGWIKDSLLNGEDDEMVQVVVVGEYVEDEDEDEE